MKGKINNVVKMGVGLIGLFCLCPISGYQAILPVLISEGAYSNLCAEDSRITDSGYLTCSQQLTRLNFMFLLATSVLNVTTLPVGILMKYLSPLIVSCIGCFIFTIGSLGFSISSVDGFQFYIVSYCLLAAGIFNIFIFIFIFIIIFIFIFIFIYFCIYFHFISIFISFHSKYRIFIERNPFPFYRKFPHPNIDF